MRPRHDFKERLLDVLLRIPALNDAVAGQANRRMLLNRLPAGPVAAITSFSAPLPDLNGIIEHADGMGQLSHTGEWSLAIVARNALRFARGTEPGRELSMLLAEFETDEKGDGLTPIPEIIIGSDERLSIDFLEMGLAASRSVAKILVNRVVNGVTRRGSGGLVCGTGWMIAPALLITNHHVIEARDADLAGPAHDADIRAQAAGVRAWFRFYDEEADHWVYQGWNLVHANRTLDFALLRRETSMNVKGKPLADWGFLPIASQMPKLSRGFRLNIIQHPQCGPKRVAIRSNYFFDSHSSPDQPDRIRYLTDTEPGSSGSPVFDDDWRVLALHHASAPIPAEVYRGEVVKYNNQGVRIDAILKALPDNIRREIASAQAELALTPQTVGPESANARD